MLLIVTNYGPCALLCIGLMDYQHYGCNRDDSPSKKTSCILLLSLRNVLVLGTRDKHNEQKIETEYT